MVLEIRVAALRIPEAVDDTSGDDGVLDGLVDLFLKVLCQVGIVPDRSSDLDKFLIERKCLNDGLSSSPSTLCKSRIKA